MCRTPKASSSGWTFAYVNMPLNPRNIRALAMTSYSAPGDADRSLEHGFDYHLVKPVDLDQIARLLSEGGGTFQRTSP